MKRSTIMSCLIVAAPLVLGLDVGTAVAGVEIQGPHTEGLFTGSSTGSFTMPQFDTLGGARTLAGVTVEVRIDSKDGKSEFDNQSPVGGLVTLAIGSTVRVKGPLPGAGSQIVVIPNAVTTASTSITATTGELPADFAGPDYAFVNGPAIGISDLKSDSRSSAGDLAPYIGTGLVTFNWDLGGVSTTGQDVSKTDGGSLRITPPTYSFQTTVNYTYVPEPSTFVLLGMGATGLLVLAWRRRQRA